MKHKLKIYEELELSLSKSTWHQRKNWAITIIKNDISIKDLSDLLKCDEKIVIRFLWMLSDVAILAPEKFLKELPYLLKCCKNFHDNFKTSFASYWLYVGVPEENEAVAIDLLFGWITSANTNVTVKARSILVLKSLVQKYPELKNELKLCIENSLGKYSKDFDKRATKILTELNTC